MPTESVEAVVDTARGVESDALQVNLGGQAIGQTEQASLTTSELVGVVGAAIVLFAFFGSLLAMLLPLASALAGLGAGLAGIGLLSQVMGVADLSSQLAILIGLGVGIDYALFIVSRHRSALKQGRTPEQAVVGALDTSGRAVLFAGATVIIALLGLFALGVGFLYGVALAVAMTVALTVLSSITLLPALLGFLGMRALSRRERRRLAASGPLVEAPSGAWARWAGRRAAPPGAGWPWARPRSWSRWRSRSSRCAWAPRTRATTPAPRPPVRPTTSWPPASAPASTGRCRWPPSSRPR